MKNIVSSTTFLLLIVLLFVSSCSVVKQNGYYQSKRYKSKKTSISLKTKRSHSKKAKTTAEYAHSNAEITTTENITKNSTVAPTTSTTADKPALLSTPAFFQETIEDTKEESLIEDKPISLRSFRKNSKKVKNHLKSSSFVAADEPAQMHWGAIVGFICSILGFLVAGLIMGICAIIFGTIALNKIKQDPDKYSGRGLAIAAIIIGIIVLLLSLILIAALAATL